MKMRDLVGVVSASWLSKVTWWFNDSCHKRHYHDRSFFFVVRFIFIDLFLTEIFRKRNCGGSANKRTVRLTETGNNQDKKNTCQIR
jgi:hypothetical protein